jgi:hypothetical protein
MSSCVGGGGVDGVPESRFGRDFCFFCFILCGGRKDARGLVVLVDTCLHEEAGDPGENPPEDAQHYPFIIRYRWLDFSYVRNLLKKVWHVFMQD